MQRWENGRSKERDYGSEEATEGRRGVKGKEDGEMETGAEREVKTEREPGERKRQKDRGRDEQRRDVRRDGRTNDRNTKQATLT